MHQNWLILIQGRKFKIVLLLLFLFDYEQYAKLKKKLLEKKWKHMMTIVLHDFNYENPKWKSNRHTIKPMSCISEMEIYLKIMMNICICMNMFSCLFNYNYFNYFHVYISTYFIKISVYVTYCQIPIFDFICRSTVDHFSWALHAIKLLQVTSSDLLLSNFSHKDIHACMHIQILLICGIIDMGHFKASYQSLLHY